MARHSKAGVAVSVAGLPLFEAHSEPLPKKRERKPVTSPTGKHARLRNLLGDMRWHSMSELQEAAGYRYGARLLELRRGHDGGPCISVEKDQRDGCWFYRQVRR